QEKQWGQNKFPERSTPIGNLMGSEQFNTSLSRLCRPPHGPRTPLTTRACLELVEKRRFRNRMAKHQFPRQLLVTDGGLVLEQAPIGDLAIKGRVAKRPVDIVRTH